MTDVTRVVLLKPGDVLLIGGAPNVEPDAWRDVVERLFRPLGVHVVVFADDIQIDKLTAEDLTRLAGGSESNEGDPA